MRHLQLTQADVLNLRHALEIAAERFKIDASTCRAEPGYERVAEQFDRQADETLRLAERVDELA